MKGDDLLEKVNLSNLTTEKRNKDTLDIDNLSTVEMLKKINDEDKKVAYAVEKEIEKIAKVIDESAIRLKRGGRIFYIGAGTSGRLGILDASECPPTFGVSSEIIQGLIAGGFEAIFKAKEGDEDKDHLAVNDLKEKNLNESDVVIGIAASGKTPYVIGGLKYANEIKALTVSITCNENSNVAKSAKISISPVVGPEVITGSTRLKAGTAQKMVLNMISTGVMIKLGKVYSNLMVDLKSTNNKLIERAKNIVIEATDISYEKATKILEETNYDVKLSIFMILSSMELDKAKETLNENEGYIKKALGGIKNVK